jgi:hypothetical protein
MDISTSNLDRETEIDYDAGIFEIPTQSWQESNYFFNHLNGTIFIYEDDKFERDNNEAGPLPEGSAHNH